MRYTISLLAATLILFTASAVSAAADTVGMLGLPIRVPAGKPSAPIHVFVFASGDEILSQTSYAAQMADLSGNADAIKVAFANVQVVDTATTTSNNKTTPSRIEWSADLSISGTIEPGKTYIRDAQLVVGTAKRHFTYQLTSKVTPLTWTLNQPSPAVALSGETALLRFSVTATGEGEPTHARVTHVTLRDANNRTVDSSAISVSCGTVAIGTPSPLTLIVDGNSIPPGNYNGTVELSLLGAADAKTFDLAISSSTPHARLIGFWCVLGGVLASMLLSGFLRNRAAYLAALLPATRMRDLLDGERKRLTIDAAATVNTRKWIDDIDTNLKPKKLRDEGFIPGWLPAAIGAGNVDTQRYTTYLQTQGDAIANITYLIERGFLLVGTYTSDPLITKTAFKDLDTLAAVRPADLQAKTDAIIGKLKTNAKAAGVGAKKTTTLTHHVQLRLDLVNATAWLFFAIVATLVGYLAAVNGAGFGMMADYLKAFLWGLGLQTAGTQLQQLTPSSVASSIGIAMPTNI